MLAEDIGKKLAMAEQVGAEGKVEESMKLMEEVRCRLKLKSTAISWALKNMNNISA